MRCYLLGLGFTSRAIAALQHGITTCTRELCAFHFLPWVGLRAAVARLSGRVRAFISQRAARARVHDGPGWCVRRAGHAGPEVTEVGLTSWKKMSISILTTKQHTQLPPARRPG